MSFLSLPTGTGYCIWSVRAMVAVQHFFDKRRGVATAFVTVGVSAGVLLWSWLTPFTIHIYTFKGALLIAAILRRPVFRPLHPVLETEGQPEIEVYKYDDKCSESDREDGKMGLYMGSTQTPSMGIRSGNKSGRPPSTNDEGNSVNVETGDITICDDNKDGSLPSESPKDAKRGIKFSDILDFSLLYKVPKITFCYIATFLMMFGDVVPYVFLPVRLAETGKSKDDAAKLLMILGISTIASRLLCGWVADVVNRDVMYAVAGLANGLVSAAFAFVTNFGALVGYCISFSLATGK